MCCVEYFSVQQEQGNLNIFLDTRVEINIGHGLIIEVT
jgi:hypothetical protein